MILTLPDHSIPKKTSSDIVTALENGQVLFFPHLSFPFSPEEQVLYSDTLLSNRKNVSYDSTMDKIHGIQDHALVAKRMMSRYAKFAHSLIEALFPDYLPHLRTARTSFRPAEVAGRKARSYRKDDTRLHVDAFPATPNQGNRLLRVFSNVNPEGRPRVWQVGESFESLVDKFHSRLQLPSSFKKYILRCCGATKSLRSDYDELMLQLHDRMKDDMDYQREVSQMPVEFPSGSTWIVFTDQVSHAALSGQYCLEQTFLLPIEGMQDPQRSPLRILEKTFGRTLV